MPWSCPLQLTFITGEKTTEIFIHSLELGHSAATRAIKASGRCCLTLGGDRWGEWGGGAKEAGPQRDRVLGKWDPLKGWVTRRQGQRWG